MRAPRRIQRRANMAAVLRHCLTGAQTIADIATATGITRPAAESVVEDLRSLGWLENVDVAPRSPRPGRPAGHVALAGTVGRVLSLDIGAHHATALSATLSGQTLTRQSTRLKEDLPGDERLSAAIDLARRTLAATAETPVLSCTVASPGVVHDGRVTYFGGAGMPGWQGVALDQTIGDALGVRVRSAGDCALGARGESWRGAAARFDDVVFILAGQRTGAATVINHRVHEGLHGAAGLIGELPALRWRDLEGEDFASDLFEGTAPGRDALFRSARQGDAVALRAVRQYAQVLATGSAAMVLALAPQCLVVGGTFSEHADLFLPAFTQALARWCPFMPEVVASALGRDAVAVGGIGLALDDIRDRIDQIVHEEDYFPSPTPASLWS